MPPVLLVITGELVFVVDTQTALRNTYITHFSLNSLAHSWSKTEIVCILVIQEQGTQTHTNDNQYTLHIPHLG